MVDADKHVVAQAFSAEDVQKHYRGMHPVYLSDGTWELQLAKTSARAIGSSKRSAYSVQMYRRERRDGTPFQEGEFGMSTGRKIDAIRRLLKSVGVLGWDAHLPDGREITLDSLGDFCKEADPFKRERR